MYRIRLSEKFRRKYDQLVKSNKQIKEKINIIFDRLREDPFQKSLKTHKVHTSQFGEVFSSRVTGDLRILWSQQGEVFVLLLLDIGGHSGNKSVY